MEGIQTEYGPGQVETNLVYTDALESRRRQRPAQVRREGGRPQARQARELHGQAVLRPVGKLGAPAHLTVARRPTRIRPHRRIEENKVAAHAIAGLLEHLPSITLFGAHSVNAYRRFEPDSFAPATVTWSRDNRSAAVRSLIESTPEATRIELRTGASDANPYWLVASALAAVVAGLEARRPPPAPADGNLYGKGTRCPNPSGSAVALATQDDTIAEILGAASVHDFATIAHSEWIEYGKQVSDWERQRYLASHERAAVRGLGPGLRQPRRPPPPGRCPGRELPAQP